jgi:hypothetical protein
VSSQLAIQMPHCHLVVLRSPPGLDRIYQCITLHPRFTRTRAKIADCSFFFSGMRSWASIVRRSSKCASFSLKHHTD